MIDYEDVIRRLRTCAERPPDEVVPKSLLILAAMAIEDLLEKNDRLGYEIMDANE